MATEDNSEFKMEYHTLVTQDNYILTLTRIVGQKSNQKSSVDIGDGLIERKGKPAVLIVHGMFGSAEHWLIQSPADKALPYKLANKGYDVWLANLRGTPLSRGKGSNGIDGYEEKKYWDFSFQEMGLFDVTGMIDYILTTTGNKDLNYIGHSLGATIFFIAMSLRPEYCSKIKVMTSLAPAVYGKHISSIFFKMNVPIGNLLSKSDFIRSQEIKTLVGAEADAKAAKTTLSFTTKTIAKFSGFLCMAMCKVFGSFQPGRTEEAAVAQIAEKWPTPISMKVLCHGFQSASSGIFCQYNYGKNQNLKLYGQETPPPYDLSKVNVPIATFFSLGDHLCTPKDIATLTEELPHSIGLHEISSPDFAHVDYMFGKDADYLVYDRVIEILRDYN